MEAFFTQLADEAETGFRQNNLKPAYAAINKIRGKKSASSAHILDLNGNVCKTSEEITERWRQHYEAALNHPSALPCDALSRHASSAIQDSQTSESAPTLAEVKIAIRKLKNGKAPGVDGIAGELLKSAEEPVSKALCELFHIVWETGRVPSEWREGLIVSLYKGKGTKNDCANYRPITLLSIPGKVFANVLLARIQPLLDKHKRPQQSGFTSGRSTADAILSLRLLAEIHRAFRRPLNVAYIDIKSAFDSVDRTALWQALQGIGMPSFLLHLIRDLHEGTTAQVRTEHGLSTAFSTTSGVRQGCVLAPSLFSCAIDWIMDQCSANLGTSIGQQRFTDIDYADDGALLTDDPKKWPDLLQDYEAAASTVGMHVNWKKTKLQNVGAGDPPPPVTIGSETVAAVDKFTYLGSDVSSSGSSSPEILRRIGMANTTMGQLDSIWKKKNLRLTTKLRLYSSLVVSVLLYGSETWTLLKEDARKIQAFHMQCQRRILGVKWFDHVSNQTISQRTGLGNINDLIADRRHTLFGHVCRAPPGVPAHEALLLSEQIADKTWSIDGWHRPPGRPRRLWTQQVAEDVGVSAQSCHFAAHDRLLWRSLRPSLGQAQQ